MDNQRLLQYFMYGLGLVVWYVLWQFVNSLVELAYQYFNWAPVEVPVLGSLSNAALVLTLGLAATIVEMTRQHETANRFGTECVSELRKVSWPNWKETRGTTVVVIIVSFAVAAILWVFDKFFDLLISFVFNFDKYFGQTS